MPQVASRFGEHTTYIHFMGSFQVIFYVGVSCLSFSIWSSARLPKPGSVSPST